MRHKFNSKSHKFLLNIIGLPSSEDIFKFPVELEMLKSKKLSFTLNKGKILNLIINFLPHPLGKNSKFEYPSIFQPNQQFIMVFFVDIFLQFIDFPQRKMDKLIHHFDVDLVIAKNEHNLGVLMG